MHRRGPPTGRERGYTLIEILIVMGLVGVFMAIILPDFKRAIPQMKVDKAAFKMAADIRMAQQKAIAEMAMVRVQVEISQNRYYALVRDRHAPGGWWDWASYDDYLEDPLKSGAYLLVDYDDESNRFRGIVISQIDPIWASGDMLGFLFTQLGELYLPFQNTTITLTDPGTGYCRHVLITYPLGKVSVLP